MPTNLFLMQKKLITLFLLTTLLTLGMKAQTESTYRKEIGIGIGLTNYLGDFNGTLTKGMQPQVSLIYKRVFNPYSALKFDLGYANIKGKSSDNSTFYPQYSEEVLTFKKSLFDLNVSYEYNFLPYGTGNDYRGAVRFTPYITIGLGATLATGEGSTAATANMPIGLGVKYKVAKRMNLALEWAFHPTMSDKLDGSEAPYGIESSGIFKNTDCYSTLRATLTYSFSANCPSCNKDSW